MGKRVVILQKSRGFKFDPPQPEQLTLPLEESGGVSSAAQLRGMGQTPKSNAESLVRDDMGVLPNYAPQPSLPGINSYRTPKEVLDHLSTRRTSNVYAKNLSGRQKNLEPWFFHTTTNADSVLKTGLLSPEYLRENVGLGGSNTGLVSLTWNPDRAKRIEGVLRLFVETAKGQVNPKDALQRYADINWKDALKWDAHKGDEIRATLWRMYPDISPAAWEQARAEKNYAPLLAELSRMKPDPHRERSLLMELERHGDKENEDGSRQMIGVYPSISSLAKIDPDNIRTFRVLLRDDAPPPHIVGSEAEAQSPPQYLELHPEDVARHGAERKAARMKQETVEKGINPFVAILRGKKAKLPQGDERQTRLGKLGAHDLVAALRDEVLAARYGEDVATVLRNRGIEPQSSLTGDYDRLLTDEVLDSAVAKAGLDSRYKPHVRRMLTEGVAAEDVLAKKLDREELIKHAMLVEHVSREDAEAFADGIESLLKDEWSRGDYQKFSTLYNRHIRAPQEAVLNERNKEYNRWQAELDAASKKQHAAGVFHPEFVRLKGEIHRLTKEWEEHPDRKPLLLGEGEAWERYKNLPDGEEREAAKQIWLGLYRQINKLKETDPEYRAILDLERQKDAIWNSPEHKTAGDEWREIYNRREATPRYLPPKGRHANDLESHLWGMFNEVGNSGYYSDRLRQAAHKARNTVSGDLESEVAKLFPNASPRSLSVHDLETIEALNRRIAGKAANVEDFYSLADYLHLHNEGFYSDRGKKPQDGSLAYHLESELEKLEPFRAKNSLVRPAAEADPRAQTLLRPAMGANKGDNSTLVQASDNPDATVDLPQARLGKRKFRIKLPSFKRKTAPTGLPTPTSAPEPVKPQIPSFQAPEEPQQQQMKQKAVVILRKAGDPRQLSAFSKDTLKRTLKPPPEPVYSLPDDYNLDKRNVVREGITHLPNYAPQPTLPGIYDYPHPRSIFENHPEPAIRSMGERQGRMEPWLFHTTTNADSILKTGLLSPEYLKENVGLGGSTDGKVSLTWNPERAKRIEGVLRLFTEAAHGRLKPSEIFNRYADINWKDMHDWNGDYASNVIAAFQTQFPEIPTDAWNRAFMTERSYKPLLEAADELVIHPDKLHRFATLLDAGTPGRAEKDGSYRAVSIFASPHQLRRIDPDNIRTFRVHIRGDAPTPDGQDFRFGENEIRFHPRHLELHPEDVARHGAERKAARTAQKAVVILRKAGDPRQLSAFSKDTLKRTLKPPPEPVPATTPNGVVVKEGITRFPNYAPQPSLTGIHQYLTPSDMFLKSPDGFHRIMGKVQKNLTPWFYHVTTNADSVLKTGLFSPEYLRENIGLGGGKEGRVSVTWSADRAKRIEGALRLASQAARGELKPSELAHLYTALNWENGFNPTDEGHKKRMEEAFYWGYPELFRYGGYDRGGDIKTLMAMADELPHDPNKITRFFQILDANAAEVHRRGDDGSYRTIQILTTPRERASIDPDNIRTFRILVHGDHPTPDREDYRFPENELRLNPNFIELHPEDVARHGAERKAARTAQKAVVILKKASSPYDIPEGKTVYDATRDPQQTTLFNPNIVTGNRRIPEPSVAPSGRPYAKMKPPIFEPEMLDQFHKYANVAGQLRLPDMVQYKTPLEFMREETGNRFSMNPARLALNAHQDKLTPYFYHVTTDKDSIVRTGLASRLMMNGRMGLGGGTGWRVSLTWNPERAERIAHALRTSARAARGELTAWEVLQEAAKLHGDTLPLSDPSIHHLLSRYMPSDKIRSGQDQMRIGRKPEEFIQHLNGKFRSPEDVYHLFQSADAALDRQLVDGSGRAIYLLGGHEDMAKVDPDKVAIFRANVHHDAFPKAWVWEENELQVPPKFVDLHPEDVAFHSREMRKAVVILKKASSPYDIPEGETMYDTFRAPKQTTSFNPHVTEPKRIIPEPTIAPSGRQYGKVAPPLFKPEVEENFAKYANVARQLRLPGMIEYKTPLEFMQEAAGNRFEMNPARLALNVHAGNLRGHFYHVTTDKDAVMRSGLVSRSMLQGRHGLGGGTGGHVSLTWNPNRAERIAQAIKIGAEAAQGLLSPWEALQHAGSLHYTRNPLSNEDLVHYLSQRISPAILREAQDLAKQGKSPTRLIEFLENRFDTPKKVYELFSDAEERLGAELMDGSNRSIILMAPHEAMEKIDPSQVVPLRVQVHKDAAPTTWVWRENELQVPARYVDIHPEDVAFHSRGMKKAVVIWRSDPIEKGALDAFRKLMGRRDAPPIKNETNLEELSKKPTPEIISHFRDEHLRQRGFNDSEIESLNDAFRELVLAEKNDDHAGMQAANDYMLRLLPNLQFHKRIRGEEEYHALLATNRIIHHDLPNAERIVEQMANATRTPIARKIHLGLETLRPYRTKTTLGRPASGDAATLGRAAGNSRSPGDTLGRPSDDPSADDPPEEEPPQDEPPNATKCVAIMVKSSNRRTR